jgi:hypothetical protein
MALSFWATDLWPPHQSNAMLARASDPSSKSWMRNACMPKVWYSVAQDTNKLHRIFDPEDSSTQGRLRPGMGGKRTKDQPFTFDRVFDDNTTQAEVYEATTKTLLDSVFDGYNATVFAYGATGCGKTHTITYVATQKKRPAHTLTRRAAAQHNNPVSSS